MRNRIVGIVAALAVCGATAPAAAASLPVVYNSAYGFAHSSPTASPPGANDFACKPTAAHPRPVILVHGTFEDMANNWQALSPLLSNNGYCVFALNYGSFGGSGSIGVYGTGYIESSAAQLGAFVDKVLAATGASRVDIVGHSQGGMMPRYYMRFDNGAAKVHTLVGLAPSNHGTTLDGLFTLSSYFPGSNAALADCPACAEQQTRLGVHEQAQRGRRHPVRRQLHRDRVAQRRGRHPVHLGVSGRLERHQHHASAAVPA